MNTALNMKQGTHPMSKTRTGQMMNWLSILFALAVVAVAFGAALFLAKPLGPSQQDFVPHGHRPFNFSCSNRSSKNIWIYSVKVLNHTVGSGRGGGVGDSRKDCTPEALLATQADFLWWEMEDPKDFNAARRGPQDPAKRLRASLPFPEFDVEASRWEVYYTLLDGDRWVGRFEGTVAKPIGAMPAPVDPALPGANQQWIHFQFRNQSDHVVAFYPRKTQLVHGESDTQINFPAIPNDKQFHCVAAHSQKGSIYRPQQGTKLEIVWYYREGSGPHNQTIDLPNFSTKTKNWYCYFTLDENDTWIADFEGVAK